MRALSSLSLAVLLAAATGAVAAERDYVPVEQRFSAEQMQATGLDTLSPAQLALLNQLLGQERTEAVAEAKAEGKRQAQAERNDPFSKVQAEPVSAAIKGEFRGYAKGDVIELENGQRWRVTDGSLYLGKAVAAPKATVRPGMMGAWYLEIEGQVPRAKVRRVGE